MAVIVNLTDSVLTTTLADLRVQLQRRGLDFLDAQGGNDEKDRLLNNAYLEICDLEDWPFLKTTMSGPAPLTIHDLRTVTSVYDTGTGRPLALTTPEDLAIRYLDVNKPGAPTHYWLDGLTTVRVWPVAASALTVRYVRVPDLLAAGSDEPVIPPRFRDLIVLRAAANALRDESAGQDQQAAELEFQSRLEEMRRVLLDQSRDLEYIRVTGGGDWGSWCL